MKEADGKTYTKTLCLSRKFENYEVAKEQCLRAGMQLFVVNDINAMDFLVETHTKLMASSKGAAVWISGVKRADGQWYSYDPKKKPLLEEVQVNSSIGKCLTLAKMNEDGTILFLAFRCLGRNRAYCEYKDQNRASSITKN